MTVIDWEAKLTDEMRRRLSPEARANVLACCRKHQIPLARFYEMALTRPGGAIDRLPFDFAHLAGRQTNGNPVLIFVASVLHAARVKE